MHSSKQNDFEKFVRCIELIESGHHLTYQGLIDIAEITQTMNRQKPRTRINQNPQRLYARHSRHRMKI